MQNLGYLPPRGSPNSVSDAGVGAMAARPGVMDASLFAKINAARLGDKARVAQFIKEGQAIVVRAIAKEAEILRVVNEKIEA